MRIAINHDGQSSRRSAHHIEIPAGLTGVINGDPHFLKLDKGRSVVPLAENLNPEEWHKVSIVKRSEGFQGVVRFNGFEMPESGELKAPAASGRKLLVLGDSITCGYGNEAADPNEGNTVENENGYMSYALIAARELDADAMLVCWSGKGMYRNRSRSNDQHETLTELFERTLPLDSKERWDHQRFIPDVIVINLGTNDSAEHHGAKEPLSKSAFIATYVDFLKRLRAYAPDSKLILSVGPMQSGLVSKWLPEIATQFEETSVLIFSKFSGRQDIGGHWHPSVVKHQKMADQLVNTIYAVTNWKVSEVE